ncbi:IS30 family transposase [Enterococcus faecalis]|uniref:IS30 family transposase n=1 Tax=Enterococcus faecalis TaxID=1351 RepID=UPI001EEEEE3F|nr:IS30 family transposase [Enterococcus faecalis]BDC77734.1 IS30 family transposase [Enterococcus faecalis]
MSYKHLSEFERGQIEILWKQGKSQAEIARELNRSRSTISREMIRNQQFDDFKRYSPKRRQHTYRYNALWAQNGANFRKKNIGKATKITPEMVNAISEGYTRRWSPEQIVNGDQRVTVSRNTVYNWILRGKISLIGRNRIRKYRRRKKRRNDCLDRQTSEMVRVRSIENRPLEANLRERFGDWEIDCVLPSREGKKCIVTLNERKSRFTFIALAENQSASAMVPIIDTFMALHGESVKSITCDRGREFANSTFIHLVETVYDKQVYFIHAYAPQERGTNENSNGLIRAFLPKKQTFESKSQYDMIHIAKELNTRPKKIHDFLTCQYIYEQCMAKQDSVGT